MRVDACGPFQQHLAGLGAVGVGHAAIADGADRGALRLLEMADTFRTALMGDHINAVVDALALADAVASLLGRAALVENRPARFPRTPPRAAGRAGP